MRSNDPPSFRYASTWFNVTANRSPQRYGWSIVCRSRTVLGALQLGVGYCTEPSDESAQAVQFVIANDTAAAERRFTEQPSIDPVTGQLAFTLRESAMSAASQTTFYVSLHDSGGTADGGNDTSAVVAIVISVVLPPAQPIPAAAFPVWIVALILAVLLLLLIILIAWLRRRQPFVLEVPLGTPGDRTGAILTPDEAEQQRRKAEPLKPDSTAFSSRARCQ